ncbi:YHS domain-containing (seleno)protein [Paracoccus laeviglucosivorans]|uniref:YHS domain-containing protein n=1 Tax=Paracoccus laeviglucosivorans TaxID=1197861 RepID=A0A521CWN9_9RHOB|nr:YHS domain-containing (seleno)protein [Paracoccus laeviglucosivorans]SMO63853.1 hypothetical protein SAMN06265221_105214 [Paracoccus laeviglucosivorans]
MIRPTALVLSLILTATSAAGQEWALNGMDPVSYSHDGGAVPGRTDIVTMWKGEAWHFANEHNRALFEANPRAYAPGMGGLCVVALSEGRPEPGNPRYFAVIDKRTYLVRSEQARKRLLADPQGVLGRAKATWARMKP